MNDDQIIEYCKTLVRANLDQTASLENATELFELSKPNNDERYLEHFKGIRNLMDKSINIMERRLNK